MKHPPKFAQWILSITSRSQNRMAVLGDFQEFFQEIYKDKGPLAARWWYWQQAVLSVPGFIRFSIYWRIAMFKNYLKIAFRNIRRHTVFSSINILGLALGLVCCIFIMLWVFDELSYDRFHEHSESLFRVEERIHYSDKVFHALATSPAVAPALRQRIPEIVDAARYDPVKNILVSYNDRRYYESDVVTAEPSFFKLFSFNFIKGDMNSALNDPNSIVISEDIAEKYFGNENPIGKTVVFDHTDQYIVKGVIETISHNTHFRFNIVIPFTYITGRPHFDENNWESSYISTYVRLDASADKDFVCKKMNQLMKEHRPESRTELYLQPLVDIHLHSRYGSGDILYIYIFSATALFVLIIACINFMILSTIHSEKRAKEIGMRKVVGAQRKHIISQFFGESFLMTLAAVVLSLTIVYLLFPQFQQISGKQLSLGDVFGMDYFFSSLFVIIIFTGLLAGSYPAFMFSSLRPIRMLKSSFSTGSGSKGFRKILVLIQFAISIFLIIATVTVKSQLSYLQSMSLGWDKEHIVYLNSNEKILIKYSALKNKLLNDSHILGVTLSRQIPGRFGNTTGNLRWEGKDPNFNLSAHFNSVDYDFPETMGIEIISGRSFSPDFVSDTETDIVINQKFEKAMGMESATGKILWIGDMQYNIIGVMKDFHIQSAQNEIDPVLLFLDPRGTRYIFIRIKPENVASTLSFLEETWKTILPDYPMEYRFLDEAYDNLYRAIARMGVLFSYFATLAIVIACLGLFGLGSFLAEKRTKEVGIRKVLGASVPGIFLLLSRDIIKWVLWANLFAWPITWYVSTKWLQNFAYKINLSVWPFLGAALSVLVIALLTMSWKAMKAATAKPIKSLRYE